MIVTVEYHREPEGVWADSPDVAGFSVAGDTMAEVRRLAREGLAFYLDDADLDIREVTEGAPGPVLGFEVRAIDGSHFDYSSRSYGAAEHIVRYSPVARGMTAAKVVSTASTAPVQERVG